jgi:methylated-DNA-[protein]-cysteine S-methyltransferase
VSGISRDRDEDRLTNMATYDMSWTTYESPFGPLTLIGDAGGLRRVCFPGRAPRLDEADRHSEAFADAAEQLEQYFAGDRHSFDLPLGLDGTPFQRRVWRALQRLPYGQTTTYGALARELGASAGTAAPEAQLVGWAIARTPTPIVVPCHRVIAADGSLTGYLGGLHRKQALLEFEAAGGVPTALRARWTQRQLALL